MLGKESVAACAAKSVGANLRRLPGSLDVRGSDEARRPGAKDKLEIPLVRSPFLCKAPEGILTRRGC